MNKTHEERIQTFLTNDLLYSAPELAARILTGSEPPKDVSTEDFFVTLMEILRAQQEAIIELARLFDELEKDE